MGDALGEGLLAAAPGVQQYGAGIGAARDRAQRASEATRAHDLSKTLGMGRLGIEKQLAGLQAAVLDPKSPQGRKMLAQARHLEAGATVAEKTVDAQIAGIAAETSLTNAQADRLKRMADPEVQGALARVAAIKGEEARANALQAPAMQAALAKADLLGEEIEVARALGKEGLPVQLAHAKVADLLSQTKAREELAERERQIAPFRLETQEHQARLLTIRVRLEEAGASPEAIARIVRDAETTSDLLAENLENAKRTGQVTQSQLDALRTMDTEEAYQGLRDILDRIAVDAKERGLFEENLLHTEALNRTLRTPELKAKMKNDLAIQLWRADQSRYQAELSAAAEGITYEGGEVLLQPMEMDAAGVKAESYLADLHAESDTLTKDMMRLIVGGQADAVVVLNGIVTEATRKATLAKGQGPEGLQDALAILSDGIKAANEASGKFTSQGVVRRFFFERFTPGGLVDRLETIPNDPRPAEAYDRWLKDMNAAVKKGEIKFDDYQQALDRADGMLKEGRFQPRRFAPGKK